MSIIICIISASLWLNNSEKKSSYMDQQRALWNELDSLLPLHCRIEKNGSDYLISLVQRNIRMVCNIPSAMLALQKTHKEYNQKVTDITTRLADNKKIRQIKKRPFSLPSRIPRLHHSLSQD